MRTSILISEGNLELEVTADVHRGSPDYFDGNHGNWLPGNQPTVENITVTISKSNRTIDLTDAIPTALKDEYADLLIGEVESEGVA